MKRVRFILIAVCLLSVLAGPCALAWDGSGSTGALGALSYAANSGTQTIALPDDGVLNYTTINIPSGVTVVFQKNAKNTPVYMLATGDVTIAGSINVSGGGASTSIAGRGGPGGHDGGYGGAIPTHGSRGFGPGAGNGGIYSAGNGGGGGYATPGTTYQGYGGTPGQGGPSYGNERLYPLVGGSGGGGGAASPTELGGGGGGGGGAILIASSTNINVTGSIYANGGAGVDASGFRATDGASGSGGAIKLVANAISGNGAISALGNYGVIYGGNGRIRLEAFTNNRTAGTNPAYTFGAPSSIFMPNPPSLAITAIGGQPVPPTATGSYNQPDITLDSTTANPVNVDLSAVNVPLTTSVKVWVTPQYGSSSSVQITLNGSDAASTGTAAVNLSRTYANVVTAETTFTVQQAFYIDGEKVDKVYVADVLGEGSSLVYITESGRHIKADPFVSYN